MQETIDIKLVKSNILKEEKVNVFYSRDNDINYKLRTDGNNSHIHTWIDKRPYQRDCFLMECTNPIKRFEFVVEDAKIIILEKRYKEKIVKDLYINLNDIYKIINNQLYEIEINDKENINIKKVIK